MRLALFQRALRVGNAASIRNCATGSSTNGTSVVDAEPVSPPLAADDYTIQEVGQFDIAAESSARRLKNIGKALESYLNRARDYEKMMSKERAAFDLGKRHLANMMGWDPNNVSQEDIDRAIEYLFPSGLTDPLARPVMKPPEEILPRFQRFSFDDEGRPLDPLFFTLKPRFYKLLSDIGVKTQRIVAHEHQLVLKNIKRPADDLILGGSNWLNKEQLSKKLGEQLTDEMYAQCIIAFEHLVSLPMASLETDFIMEHRREIAGGLTGERKLFGPQVPEVIMDAERGKRVARATARVKSTTCTAEVNDMGTGIFTVNGQHYDEFRTILAREILISPLIVTDLFGKVDIRVTVDDGPGGLSVIPRVSRHAVSLCLAALYPDLFERLRLAGLLTGDPRRKERSKVNQPGARAKWIWKRR
ncbi:hypothetical protein L596_024851 [Steinernema carpocapsae]|uniref:Ribosomal protein S9 n=1 Tax=Steinernema carpocapsae TaxID=34508 RepID=A0A4U5M605_STECR|nr:hypothetical protein L596_024851 [Steinernema carpocapsae]